LYWLSYNININDKNMQKEAGANRELAPNKHKIWLNFGLIIKYL